MKLTAYTRVSTQDQVDNGQGLDLQKRSIEQWATDNGHTIIHWYSDEGVSGTNAIENRPGLESAIATIRYNGSEGLVVSTIDRLARDLIVQELTLQEIWKADGKVYATDQGEVDSGEDNPTAELVRHILGAIAHFDRRMIRHKLHRGRMRKREEGGYIGGPTPYGYEAEEGELVEDPKEAPTVQIITGKRLEGATYQAIADHLNELDIPTRSGGSWYKMTVQRIVKREMEGVE